MATTVLGVSPPSLAAESRPIFFRIPTMPAAANRAPRLAMMSHAWTTTFLVLREVLGIWNAKRKQNTLEKYDDYSQPAAKYVRWEQKWSYPQELLQFSPNYFKIRWVVVMHGWHDWGPANLMSKTCSECCWKIWKRPRLDNIKQFLIIGESYRPPIQSHISILQNQ